MVGEIDDISIGIEMVGLPEFETQIGKIEDNLYSLSKIMNIMEKQSPFRRMSEDIKKVVDVSHPLQSVFDEVLMKPLETFQGEFEGIIPSVFGKGKGEITEGMTEEWAKQRDQLKRLQELKGWEGLDFFGDRSLENLTAFDKAVKKDLIPELNELGLIAQKNLKGFQMDYLGIMFLGMQIQRTFQGLLDPMLKGTGITETYSDALESLMEPLEPLVYWLDGLISGLEDLHGPVKWLISGVTLLGFVLGTLLFTVGMMRLGLNSMNDAAIKSGVGLKTFLLQPLGWLLTPFRLLGSTIINLGANIITSGGIVKIFGNYLINTKEKILGFGRSLKTIDLKQKMLSLRENANGLLEYGRALVFGTEKTTKMEIAQRKLGKGMASFKLGLMGIGTTIGGLLLGAFLMSSSFNEVFEDLGDIIEPIVTSIADFFSSLEEGGWLLIGILALVAGALLLVFAPAIAPIITVGLLIGGLVLIFTNILPVLQGIWTKLGEIFGAGLQWIKDNVFAPIGEWIDKNVTPVWEGLKNKISEVWEGIKTNISIGWNWIKDNIFTPISNFIIEHVNNVWGGLKTSITDIWEGIKNAISNAWDKISGIWETIKTAFSNVLSNPFEFITNGLTTLWNNLKDLFSWIDSHTGGFMGKALDVIMNSASSLLKLIGLADGGIVSSPTLAMVGEAGPEAVIPLDRMGSMGTNIGSVNINVTVSGSGGLNERQLADRIGDVVIQKFRNTITR